MIKVDNKGSNEVHNEVNNQPRHLRPETAPGQAESDQVPSVQGREDGHVEG